MTRADDTMMRSLSKYTLTASFIFLLGSWCFAQKRDSSGHLTYNAVIEIAQKKGGRYFRKTDGWHAHAVFDTTANTWTVTSRKETFPHKLFSQWDYRKTQWKRIVIDDKTGAIISRKKGRHKQIMYPE